MLVKFSPDIIAQYRELEVTRKIVAKLNEQMEQVKDTIQVSRLDEYELGFWQGRLAGLREYESIVKELIQEAQTQTDTPSESGSK